MSERPSIRLNSVDIAWDLERGALSFFGLDSVLFWTNPSMYRLLSPLVEELGTDLFRLLVAHSSSLGTDADYEVMVTQLGADFVSGFLAWGEAVATAGWGRFEVLAFDPAACTARVRVYHPWELKMQQDAAARWGCPFMQGKIIGLFSHAFGRSCWADEQIHLDPERPYLDLLVYPSERVLEHELKVLRREVRVRREHELQLRIERATSELQSQVAVIDQQRELIARLTYPILQVWSGVLAAVLVGELDDSSMSDLTYALLERVQLTRARHVILDCTGVPALSVTQAASLTRLVAALRLLGTRPTLVGISPAAAEGLAQEPDALAGARTLQTLADALQRVIGLRPA
jgi:anti-anti-sigma regulatory factor